MMALIWKWTNALRAHNLFWAADICDRRADLMLRHGRYHEAWIRRAEADALRVKAAQYARRADHVA